MSVINKMNDKLTARLTYGTIAILSLVILIAFLSANWGTSMFFYSSL